MSVQLKDGNNVEEEMAKEKKEITKRRIGLCGVVQVTI